MAVASRDRVAFWALAASLAAAGGWVAGGLWFLGGGAFSHVQGLFLALCTSVAHISKDVALVVWAGSVALMSVAALLVVAGTLLRTRSIVGDLSAESCPASEPVLDLARDVGLECEIRVVDCPEPLVFVHGFARPAVVLSTSALLLLTDDEARAVLAHEARHVVRRDPLRLLIARLASTILAPFPVIEALRRHFALITELEADRNAMQRAGRRPLASAVLKFAEAPVVGGVANFSDDRVMEARVSHIADPASLDRLRLRVTACEILTSGAVAAGTALILWAALRTLPM